MRSGLVVALCLLARLSFAGDETPLPPPETRQATLAAGVGSTVAGVGLSAEKYLGHGVFSVLGGIGYVYDTHDGRGATGAGVAAALRAYSHGRKHRIFGELSFSPVAVEVAPEGSGLRGQTISYGPGASAGYNLVTHCGFTLSLSAGIAKAVTGGADNSGFISSLTLGHTWVRR